MLIKSPWGGIISTTYDYALFLQMLMNQGHLNGKRILGRKTVELISRGLYGQGSESTTAIGLSISVVTNEQGHYHPESVGAFVGGGYFYTSFWVDPKEQMIGVLINGVELKLIQDLSYGFKIFQMISLKSQFSARAKIWMHFGKEFCTENAMFTF